MQHYPITARAAPPDDRTRVLKYGSMFAVFDRYGDIEPLGLAEHGIFFESTRYLSQLILEIGGTRPLLLSSTVKQDNSLLTADLANVDLVANNGDGIARGTLLITRSKFLWKASCFERLKISNYGLDRVRTFLDLWLDADFADIFEVRGTKRKAKGAFLPEFASKATLTLGYRGLDQVVRYLHLSSSSEPEELHGKHCRFELNLGPKEERVLEFCFSCTHEEQPGAVPGFHEAKDEREREGQESSILCEMYSSNEQFNNWARRSIADLEMMVQGNREPEYPYAGVPWFNTVFGRDGIITAMQMLWMHPQIARGVLEYLAATQATELNAQMDSEPGKIVHETRDGEMAALGEVPFRCYYGSIDSTPLFLMLLSKYYARTADMELVSRLWPNVERALHWIDHYGDRDGDGFVEYARRSDRGLVQQGWKDSTDSVFHQNGSLAEPPIALCEVQAYVFAAKRWIAELARLRGDNATAIRLEQEAQTLRKKFWDAFWCPDLNMYALALDGEKRPCKVRASNAGHCLYARIAHPDHARGIAQALLTDNFFTGWGVRTLASTEIRYNPVSYHNGSVWPHDNSILAAGLARYGFKEQCAKIFAAFLEVSQEVDLHRLPELFCGLERREGESPTLYPVACSPQAWSAGSILLFLQACLGISVNATHKQLTLHHPMLPDSLPQVWIKNLTVNSSTVDLFLERSGETVRVHVLGRHPDLRIVLQ